MFLMQNNFFSNLRIESKNKILLVLLSIISAVWLFGIFSSSILGESSFGLLANFYLSFLYSKVCHQADHKSFMLGVDQLLVCSRCTGIYIGVFFSLIISLFVSKNFSKKMLMIIYLAVFILLLDVLVNNYFLTNYFKISAFISGFIFAFLISLFSINYFKKESYDIK
ncbi:MAG: hypothetical protein C0442_00415 [Chlorobiaceae bacterium]|nr:hypothetical protein [Chlorobiaceae bacterium]